MKGKIWKRLKKRNRRKRIEQLGITGLASYMAIYTGGKLIKSQVNKKGGEKQNAGKAEKI